jgi:hypothetical protein
MSVAPSLLGAQPSRTSQPAPEDRAQLDATVGAPVIEKTPAASRPLPCVDPIPAATSNPPVRPPQAAPAPAESGGQGIPAMGLMGMLIGGVLRSLGLRCRLLPRPIVTATRPQLLDTETIMAIGWVRISADSPLRNARGRPGQLDPNSLQRKRHAPRGSGGVATSPRRTGMQSGGAFPRCAGFTTHSEVDPGRMASLAKNLPIITTCCESVRFPARIASNAGGNDRLPL